MRFLMVDVIHELEPGRRIRASKRLPADEQLFEDHFPGFPVVPGVLLTEMMAQAAAKCLESDGTHHGRAMLTKIVSATFRSFVRPDEDAMIRAEITQNQPACATARGVIDVDGRKVCSAELFFVFLSEGGPEAQPDPVLDAYWLAHSSKPTAGA